MHIKRMRQILKSLADDTRLRIINVLNGNELNVADLCEILDVNQPLVSKHLTRLRLTGLVFDKREGQFVYYYLSEPKEVFLKDLVKLIISERRNTDIFQEDLKRLKTKPEKSS